MFSPFLLHKKKRGRWILFSVPRTEGSGKAHFGKNGQHQSPTCHVYTTDQTVWGNTYRRALQCCFVSDRNRNGQVSRCQKQSVNVTPFIYPSLSSLPPVRGFRGQRTVQI